ncbi:MAG: SRPBCC domain-containing protein, partial [Alphaproteobacteria bacterium]
VFASVPGAELLERPEPGRFRGRIRVRLGPIAPTFEGEGEAEWDDGSLSGRVRGRGADKKSGSRVHAELAYTLVAAEGGAATRVEIEVDYALTGALAQFGRGAIATDVARRLADEFARALAAKLSEAAPSDAAPAPVPVPPVALGGMLWRVLLARLGRWLRRLFGIG